MDNQINKSVYLHIKLNSNYLHIIKFNLKYFNQISFQSFILFNK